MPQDQPSDHAIERCGRRAAELLVAGDVLLADRSAEPVLAALLTALDQPTRAQVHVIHLDQVDHDRMPTVCLISSLLVALDGGALCSTSARRCADFASRQSLPCYLLAPHGPSAATPNAALITLSPGCEYLPPNQINAIITDRALYRPAMIDRYFGDSDTPFEVIPLLGYSGGQDH